VFGATLIAHAAFPAPVVFTSEGLFVAGMSAVFGAYWVAHHREGTPGRDAVVDLGLAAAGCFSVATVLPFLIGPGSLSDDPRRSEPGSHPSVPRRFDRRHDGSADQSVGLPRKAYAARGVRRLGPRSVPSTRPHGGDVRGPATTRGRVG